MGGTAISALTTVKLVTAHSLATPFVVTAVGMGTIAGLLHRRRQRLKSLFARPDGRRQRPIERGAASDRRRSSSAMTRR
jgi:hypothetical protein